MTDARSQPICSPTLEDMFRAGSDEAWAELVRQHEAFALQYAQGLLRNFHDAQDVASDSFLKARKSCNRFEPQWSFLSWFRTILHNTCIDLIRRKKNRAGRLGTSTLRNLDQNQQYPNEYFNDPVEESEILERLQNAIAALDPDSLSLFVLVHLQGHLLAEASRLLSDGANDNYQKHWKLNEKMIQKLATIYPKLFRPSE